VGKQVVKAEYLSSEQSRMRSTANCECPINWGPCSAQEIQLVFNNKISNTSAMALTDIDRDPELKPRVAGLPNIKQFHSFTYEGNLCCMRELTHDEKPLFFHFQYL